ncbi:MAG: methionyl-tRNA formyltransferase [Chlamydiae bacterium]|nr:methionyl-tRNA formyltransferase [Chlamydiota bacterium]
MNVIFFGTPEFAEKILQHLLSHSINIVAVVTGQDKPRGRSQKLQPTEVKQFMQDSYPSIPVFQPIKASDPEFVEKLKTYNPDVFVVVSYGQILKQNLLDAAKILPINIHPSMLPLYRGPSPIRAPLLNKDSATGVTIMKMVLEMDAGDILMQEEFVIPEDMVFTELEGHLLNLSCRLIMEVLQKMQSHLPLEAKSQSHHLMNLTKKTVAEDLVIDFSQKAEDVHAKVRAFSYQPGAYAYFDIQGKRKRIKILRTHITDIAATSPGKNIFFHKNQGWVLSCKDLGLKILEVQPEGGRAMNIKDFMNGISEPVFQS